MRNQFQILATVIINQVLWYAGIVFLVNTSNSIYLYLGLIPKVIV